MNDQKSNFNKISLNFLSKSENVALARIVVATLIADRDISMAELDEIKVAISEAVSNAIIHGYQGNDNQMVEMYIELTTEQMIISIHDDGVGIEDIELAMRPGFSTLGEHMGLGFAFMTSFMDKVEVQSSIGRGTTIILSKNFSASAAQAI